MGLRGEILIRIITFDLKSDENLNLEALNGKEYTRLTEELEKIGFKKASLEWTMGNVYTLSDSEDNFCKIFNAVSMLKNNTWFRKNIISIKTFVIIDSQDITNLIK